MSLRYIYLWGSRVPSREDGALLGRVAALQCAVLPEFRFGITGNRRFSGSCDVIATARGPSR
ncbi:MAG: hypothetical protein WB014_03585 [Methanosarcina sp.]